MMRPILKKLDACRETQLSGRMLASRRFSVTVLVVGLTLLFGCSSSKKAAAPERTTSTGSEKDASTGGTVDLGRIVATGTTSDKQFTIKVELFQLRRRGGLVTLNFKVANTVVGSTDSWFVGDFFGGNEVNDFTVSGIYLVDTANKKRYPAARDTNGRCVCSNTRVGVSPGQSMTLFATFAAPPTDVKSVDVAIPHVGAFPGVPLE
jgi:hypothetical protein